MSRSAGSANFAKTVTTGDVPAAPTINSVADGSPAGTVVATVTVPTLNVGGGALSTPVSKIHLFWSKSELPTDNRVLFGEVDDRAVFTKSVTVVGTPATVTVTAASLDLGAAYFFAAVAEN